jgi:predicted metal-dependent hydrolase
MNINLQLEEIILLLNQNKFVESHDVFEELWREYKKDESTRKESFILKAFVNGSVSIELYKMQRFEHSLNVWNTYKKYEYLIDEIDSFNKKNYQKIKEIIYEKREKYIK